MKPSEDPLGTFARLVEEVARPRGLVGFEDIPTEIYRSLALLEVVGNPETLIDVGSGAGFPGIPLAISLPGTTVLIEPRRRARAFLEKVVRRLELPVTIVGTRAEEAAQSGWGGRGEVVVARALAAWPQALAWCTPLCRPGGRIVLTASASGSPAPATVPSGIEGPQRRVVTGPHGVTQQVLLFQKPAG